MDPNRLSSHHVPLNTCLQSIQSNRARFAAVPPALLSKTSRCYESETLAYKSRTEIASKFFAKETRVQRRRQHRLIRITGE